MLVRQKGRGWKLSFPTQSFSKLDFRPEVQGQEVPYGTLNVKSWSRLHSSIIMLGRSILLKRSTTLDLVSFQTWLLAEAPMLKEERKNWSSHKDPSQDWGFIHFLLVFLQEVLVKKTKMIAERRSADVPIPELRKTLKKSTKLQGASNYSLSLL